MGVTNKVENSNRISITFTILSFITDKIYMNIRLLIVLSTLFFSIKVTAGLAIVFNPNYNGIPANIPAGTTFLSLCSGPKDFECLKQWSNQSLSLAVYPQEAEKPHWNYFVPAYQPSETVNKDRIQSNEWEIVTLSPQETTDSRKLSVDQLLNQENQTPGRTLLRNLSNPDEIRVVDTNEQGQQKIQAGTVNFVPLDDIQQTEDGNLKTQRNTVGLPATTKKVPPGCFVIDKPEETEAKGPCIECEKKGQEGSASVLFSLGRDPQFRAYLDGYLKKVTASSARKVQAQTVVSGSSVQKICAPEISLKEIIKNFNRTCPEPYKNNFEGFFKTAYCESCKKGIPPEIMMAKISIESAGKCPAEAKNEHENSVGIAQNNARVHQCHDHRTGKTHQRNTEANRECFKDPINSMNSGVDILFKYYNKANPNPIETSQCKSWLEMNPTERDSWRKAVSDYNGGPGWRSRAITSVRNRQTLISTQYLSGTHKTVKDEYKTDSLSWEELRVAYFVEKVVQQMKTGSTKGTGRKLSLTISNLAHTEAILGRNVKTPAPAMVEIWSQFLKKNEVSCTR